MSVFFKGNLENHMRIHSGDRPYECKICGAKFSQAGHLLTHNRIHTGVKPYKCDKCPSSFTVILIFHLRIYYIDYWLINNFRYTTGQHCSEETSSNTHGWVSQSAMLYSYRKLLNDNNILNTASGERPYGCTVCDKKFNTAYHLATHEKRHTGEKKFKCDWPSCQLSFVNVSEMRRHRKRHDKTKKLLNSNTWLGVTCGKWSVF